MELKVSNGLYPVRATRRMNVSKSVNPFKNVIMHPFPQPVIATCLKFVQKKEVADMIGPDLKKPVRRIVVCVTKY